MPFYRVSKNLFMVGLVTVLFAAAPMATASLDPGGTFGDDNSSIHEAAIEAIAEEGITKGCNPPVNTLFCPGESVTREQMATFLVRALDLPAGTAFFTDIGDSVHAANIEALATAGITKGCNPPDNTLFCPTSPVTREQMATFLTRGLGLTPIAPPDPLPDDVPGDLVLIGDQNWLYFDETVTQTCLTVDPYIRLVAEIDKAATVVEASGRDFVYTIAPNKATVYPDYVPSYAGSCAEANTDLLYSVLLASSDPSQVDLVTPFQASSEQLYWKHDTHWDVNGALLGSELIAALAAPGSWNSLDLMATPASRQGDLASILGVDWEIDYDEQSPALTGVTPMVTEQSIAISGRPLITYTSSAAPELEDRATVVIHDSFGMFFRNKLGPLFENVTFLPTFTHPIPDDGGAFVINSDQIVIEVVERNVLRDFIGTGTAGMLASILADDFTPTAVANTRNGEQVDFTIPTGSPGDLRYLIVELDTSGLMGPTFIGDPTVVDIPWTEGAWPDELTLETTRYGFEVMVESGTMTVPLPSSVSVTAAYVIVIE